MVTEFILSSKQLLYPPVERVIFCYSEEQEAYETLQNQTVIPIKFFKGFNREIYESIPPNSILALDDLFNQVDHSLLTEIVQRGTHHRKLTFILLPPPWNILVILIWVY